MDLHYFKLPRSLKYADRAAMRFSIETRLPLITSWLKSAYKCHRNLNLLISIKGFYLRNILKAKLKIINLKTKDQSLILNNFGLEKNLKKYIQDTLLNKINKSDDIFDYNYIQSFYKKFLSSKKHINSYFILSFLNVITWREKVLK